MKTATKILGLCFFMLYLSLQAQVSKQINFSANEVSTFQAGDYDFIQMEHTSSLSGEAYVGQPQLPVKSITLALPKESKATHVHITTGQLTFLQGTFNIALVQPPRTIGAKDTAYRPAEQVPDIYGVNAAFPNDPLLSYANHQTREYSYVTINFIPFSYNPQTGQLGLYQQLSISVTYTGGNPSSGQTGRPGNHADVVAYKSMQQVVANPQQFEQFYTVTPPVAPLTNSTEPGSIFDASDLPSKYGSVVPYVIITNNTTVNGDSIGNLVEKFQEFADWKMRKGTPAKVVTVDAIRAAYQGGDVQEKIRHFIQEAADTTQWKTEYVLLGGTAAIVPTRKITNQFTDLYYAALKGSWNANGNSVYGEYSDNADFTPDIQVGRAPVNTADEAQIFLKKNFTYNRCSLAPNGNIPDGAWLGNLLGIYGLAYQDDNWEDDGLTIYTGYQIVHDHRNDTNIWGMFEYLKNWNDSLINSNPNPNYHPDWCPAYWPLHAAEGACTEDYISIDNEDITHTGAINQIENGYGIIDIIDHGGPNAIGIATETQHNYLRADDFENLPDTGMYPFMLAGDCHTAPIEMETYIGERWVNSPGGGVAFFGNSRDIGTTPSVNFNKEFFNLIYSGNAASYNLSALRNQTIVNYGSGWENYLHKIYQLLGDPQLDLYTAAPDNLMVNNYPTSITLGHHTDFGVHVSLDTGEEALVSLYKDGEVSAYGYANDANNGDLTFNITPDTQGDLYLTVTAHNKNPYEETIQVTQPQTVHLYKSNVAIDDHTYGNGNGVVEPGEKINLTIEVSNTGGSDATGISGVLTSPEPQLAISQNTATYPDINSDASANSNQAYTFTAPSSDTIRAIPVLLILTSDQGEFKEPFLLNTKSADLQLGDHHITKEPNFDTEVHTFFNGEEVHISLIVNNNGMIAAKNVTGVLSTDLSSSIASVNPNSPTANYGDIDPNDYSSNIGNEFIVNIGNSYNSQALPFTLTLTDEFGLTKSFDFDLTDYMNEISDFSATSYSHHIDMEWHSVTNAQGYNVYRSLSENGLYEKVNDLVLTASTYDDLNLDPLTEYWYKISAVSQTGDERPLDELTAHSVQTKIGKHPGFPVAAYPAVVHGAHSSPTVYDIDGDGTKEIFVAYRDNISSTGISGRLMGFKETGEELFDIDGTDNIYGFAGTEKQLYAKPALGDLEGDGQAEVIAVGRGFYDESDNGAIYGFRTTDQDGDGKPDKLWNTGEKGISHKIYRNPVLADLDNDGYQEILVLDEYQTLHVFDHNGTALSSFQIQGSDFSEGQLAVADIDNDGFKEVVFGVRENQAGKGAIYIWNPDGDFTVAPLLFHEFASGEHADNGVVLADIDRDHKYELLTITRQEAVGRVYVFNIEDGSYFKPNNTNNWNGSKTIQLTGESTDIPRIAVGNIDHNNSNLEIVYRGAHKLYADNYDGTSKENFPISGLTDPRSQSPILADIDDDDDIEIIINKIEYDSHHIAQHSVLKAYNPDGSECRGWNLSPDTPSFFAGSPYVGDIDNDGKNEIVISSGDNAVYVYDTQGDADKVEWGGYRHDAQNTGAYGEASCVFDPDSGLDLMVRRASDDRGGEPYVGGHNLWGSPDIWVRNQDDGKLNHTNQNPAYTPDQPNFIYVRIQNKGCTPTTGEETLKLNWAKASSGLAWTSPWLGGTYFAGALMGGGVGERNIPILGPGEEVILKFPWMVPNPADYVNLDLGSSPMHFCLLARVNAEEDPIMPLPSGSTSLNDYVRTNNNVAWKNVTVTLVAPGEAVGANFLMANFGLEQKNFDLELVAEESNLTAPIFDQAEVRLHLSDRIYQKWKNGGSRSDYLQPTRQEHVLLVTHDHARLKNIQLNHGEVGTVGLTFNFLTDQVTDQMRFLYGAIQKENSDPHRIIGGETYLIKRRTRKLFHASAKVGKADVDSVTVKADTINEPAVYNWYGPQGNLIHSGPTLTVNSAKKGEYKLEVIAQSDGYKDYAKVHVKNSHGLKSLTPNPASNAVLVNYAVNSESSAYLMITNSVSGTFNNYLIDPAQSAITVDLTGCQTGVYIVSLVVNGEIIDYKHLLVN